MRKVSGASSAHMKDFLGKLQELLIHTTDERSLQTFVRALREEFGHYTWVGIYVVQGERLVLASYAGNAETEHVSIRMGQGICGSAAKSGETVLVPDVNKDTRYLMCFPSTRSEIVVPIIGRKGVIGEIDVDSDKLAAFTNADKELLEGAAAYLAEFLEKLATVEKSPMQRGE